jgi:cytoskeleton protein RodZ
MNDEQRRSVHHGAADAGRGDVAAAPAVGAEDSFGAALRRAREAQSLSVNEVAAQLRLAARQIAAIEAEDLSRLPQGAFVRGFVRNYAKLLGLPAAPLIVALDRRLAPLRPLRLDDAAAINPVQLAAREHASRVMVVGGALAALLVFAVAGWLSMRPTAAPPQPAPVAAPAPAVAAAVLRRDEAGTPAVKEPGQPAALPVAQTSRSELPVATDPVQPDPRGPSPNALRFDFRERSWVEIVQADGKVLMSQNNEPGTQMVVEGRPPYLLVIGNAPGVQLEFRGETVALDHVTSRENVARLRLN